MIDADRALRACRDVMAVEMYAPGMCRVVTLGGVYVVDARGEGCQCPDKEYHLGPGEMCKHHAAAFLATSDDHPTPFLVREDLDRRTEPAFDLEVPDRIGRNRQLSAFETDGGKCAECADLPDGYPCAECYIYDGAEWPTVMTDGGQVEPERSGNRPEGHDQWTLWDAERENARHFDERSTAEDRQEQFPDLDLELFPPGESPEALYHAEGNPETDTTPTNVDAEPQGSTTEDGEKMMGVDVCVHCGQDIDDGLCPDCDGDQPEAVDAEVIDHTSDTPDHDAEYQDLPDRDVGQDPLTWMPGEFVDSIDGSQAVNRKGFEVLSHFYDIDVKEPEVMVNPHETDFTYCQVRATAVTGEGRECSALGSAHIDRGDDPELLLEMADTRARKRALSIATGVGAVAVEELKNEVDQ